MLVSLEEIKTHLRIDSDDDSQDNEISSFVMAASSRLEKELQRNVYRTRDDAPIDDHDAIVLDEQRRGGEDLKLAIKLLVGHFYTQREQSTELSLRQIPEGFKALTSVYRLISYGGRI